MGSGGLVKLSQEEQKSGAAAADLRAKLGEPRVPVEFLGKGRVHTSPPHHTHTYLFINNNKTQN